MSYIRLHNAETGNEIIVFLHNVFFIEENMIMGNNPENRIFVTETAEEIKNILDKERKEIK